MKKGFLILLGLCCVALAVLAWPSLKPWVYKESDVPTIKMQDSMTSSPLSIQEIKTSLNSPIWFVPTDIPVVSLSITFRHAGDKSSPSNLPGLTDLIAALLDEGAGPYDSQSFKKMLLEKNINLSISSNLDNFSISFRTIKENFGEALDLIHLILTSPRFASEDMQRVKEQISASLQQSLHMPGPVAKEALQKYVYGETHPYYRRIEDRIKSLSAISAEDLKGHMRQLFTRSNLEVTVCGNVSPEEITEKVETTFKDLPAGQPIPAPSPTELQNLGKVFTVEMDIPQTLIYLIQPGIARKDPDFYAFFVGMRILGSGEFESRLWNEIREKRGLAYFCSADVFTNDLTNGVIGATATKTESVDQTISLIKEEWQKIIDQGIGQAELDFQKKNLMGSYPLSFGSTLDIVRTLVSYRNDGLPIDYIQNRNSYFEKLNVDDINRVLRKILKPSLLTFVIVGRSRAKTEVK